MIFSLSMLFWLFEIPPVDFTVTVPLCFFQLQFTRANIQPPAGQDPQSTIVPLLYDISANTIQHMEPVRGQPQTPAYMAVSQLLQNFYHPQSAECILFPAVQHIMANLNL